MCRPVFRIESESTANLKATLRAMLKDGGDAAVIKQIRDVLTRRVLGMEREGGWPTVLDDPEDDGLPFE